jgi:hypothetical protein
MTLDFALCAIEVRSLSLDLLRTVGSPAAQMRPEFRLKTRATHRLGLLAPTSGQATNRSSLIFTLGLSTRCESPAKPPFDSLPKRTYTLGEENEGKVHDLPFS